MRLLAFGDTHIKPTDTSMDLDGIELPAGTDAVVTVGDVVHRTGADDVAVGREFLAGLADAGVPVYSVPGNHDPMPTHTELTDGLEGVECFHETVDSVDAIDLLGLGCDRFDVGPEVTCRDFESLDPRTGSSDRRHAADENARRLEAALHEYVTTDVPREDVATRLEIREDEFPTLWDQLDAFDESYNRLASLFERATPPTVVLSHVPPYGTELDRHHSLGEREADLDELHVGSVALKIAFRVHRPAVAISGHSHNPVYETLSSGDGVTHLLNLGFQGVATLDYAPDDGFGYERHS